jgi:hypothetical protein
MLMTQNIVTYVLPSFTIFFLLTPHLKRHSEVPTKDEDWPTLGTILAFRDRVRARLLALYDDFASGKRKINRNVGRMLAMTLEHEGWHVEVSTVLSFFACSLPEFNMKQTLLYMLIQRAGTGTQPPAGFVPPPWEALSAQWDVTYMPPATLNVTLGPSSITLGHDDCEGKDFNDDVHDQVEGHQFGWDNESPSRQVEVGQFRVEWRPISNGEFHDWWVNRKEIGLPPSWVEAEEEIQVCYSISCARLGLNEIARFAPSTVLCRYTSRSTGQCLRATICSICMRRARVGDCPLSLN